MLPILNTKRLLLRTPQMEDAVDIMALANSRRIADMLARMPHPYGFADAQFFMRRCQAAAARRDAAHFGLYLPGSARPEFIGSCGFDPLGDDPVPHLGYWIGERYWGKGYASEAARAVMDFAFGERGLPQLHSGCRPDNHGSRAVLEKLGFRHVGVGTIYAAARRRHEPIDRFVMDAADWRRMRT